MKNTKRRKVAKWFENYTTIPEVKFYKDRVNTLSTIPEVEREFFWNWCEIRHLDGVFPVVALTYWVRARSDVAVNFLLDDSNKSLYMVLCIQIALKWLGYDEDHKCEFFKDLVELNPSIQPYEHRRMEYHLLVALNWIM